MLLRIVPVEKHPALSQRDQGKTEGQNDECDWEERRSLYRSRDQSDSHRRDDIPYGSSFGMRLQHVTFRQAIVVTLGLAALAASQPAAYAGMAGSRR
jgi:hypothetical protein